MLWDEPKIFFLERRYFFSIILSEFLKNRVALQKLHGVYRLMMEIMVKTAGKALAEKKDRTPDEDDMLDMMLHGGERVKEENLGAVLDWYSAQR